MVEPIECGNKQPLNTFDRIDGALRRMPGFHVIVMVAVLMYLFGVGWVAFLSIAIPAALQVAFEFLLAGNKSASFIETPKDS